MTDWQPYLTSICAHKEYRQWWKFYTATDATGEQADDEQDDAPPLMNLGLMVETVVQANEDEEADDAAASGKKRPEDEKRRKVERLDVLAGLRKYAAEHLLLVGRPGSGKSTALVRLLLEEAQTCLESDDETVIPVLVELRYFRSSVMDLIRSFLKRHGVLLEIADIEQLLFDGRFLLLVDGVNELPSEEARRSVKVFRQNHPKTAMIFTTRDIGLGGDLGIGRKLEMQRLSGQQMKQFVCQYLPVHGEQMWWQMGEQLKWLGETPLLLWMLCSVFDEPTGALPDKLGLVFRKFAQQYDRQIKEDAVVKLEHRVIWSELLQCLAFEMVKGDAPTEILVAISQDRAIDILTEYLENNGKEKSRLLAKLQLTELLKHHLIQRRADNQIEFRHQLIQEYYAAESLRYRLKRLLRIDKIFKSEYLNHLKWTEPLKLLLELLDEEHSREATSLIEMALEVDLRLCFRILGGMTSQSQSQAIGLLDKFELSTLPRIYLLTLANSNKAIPQLLKALQSENSTVRLNSVQALKQLSKKLVVQGLSSVLDNKKNDVRRVAANALRDMESELAVPSLLKALKDEDYYVRRISVEALIDLGSKSAVPGLLEALECEDSDVRLSAIDILGHLEAEEAIPSFLKALDDEYHVSKLAAEILERLDHEWLIPDCLNLSKDSSSIYSNELAAKNIANLSSHSTTSDLIKALRHKDHRIRRIAVEFLPKSSNELMVPVIVKALEDDDLNIRKTAAETLFRWGNESAIIGLSGALEHKDGVIREFAVRTLPKLKSQSTIPSLLKALEDKNYSVRRSAAKALTQVNSKQAAPKLLKALQHPEPDVRRSVVAILEKLGVTSVATDLFEMLDDDDPTVRRSIVMALGNLSNKAAIPKLLEMLDDDDSTVRSSVALSLGKLGDRKSAIPTLLKVLDHRDSNVRESAVSVLGAINDESVALSLVRALEDEISSVRNSVVKALVNLNNEVVIPDLIKILERKNSRGQEGAAVVLGKLDSKLAMPFLLKALEEDGHLACQNTATVLRNLNGTLTVPVLLKALENKDSYVRASAIEATKK